MKKLFPAICLLLFCIPALLSCRKDRCEKDVTDKVYVANEDDGTVSVFDAMTCERLAVVELGSMHMMYMPHNVQCAPDRRSVWVTANEMDGMGADQLISLYPHGDKVQRQMNCGMDQHLAHVVFSADGVYAFASANEKDEILRLRAENGEDLVRFPLRPGCMPHGIRMGQNHLWVACMSDPGLIRVNPENGDTLCIGLKGMGVQVACRKAGDYVFVSMYDRCGVIRYAIQTGDTFFCALPASSRGPVQLCMTVDDSLLMVCDQGMLQGREAGDKIYFLNPITGAVVDSVVTGTGPHGVCVSDDGTRAYVTNQGANTLCMVSLQTHQVIRTVATGAGPNGVTYLLCP